LSYNPLLGMPLGRLRRSLRVRSRHMCRVWASMASSQVRASGRLSRDRMCTVLEDALEQARDNQTVQRRSGISEHGSGVRGKEWILIDWIVRSWSGLLMWGRRGL